MTSKTVTTQFVRFRCSLNGSPFLSIDNTHLNALTDKNFCKVRASFSLYDDEWYTFDKNPRPNVHILATVDEASYNPPLDIRMGDHPVVWVNPKMKARNVYFLTGHHASLLQSADFTTMSGNAILWSAGK